MTLRTAGIVMSPIESDEAPGVRLRRTIGSDKLILLDPFLLLDHMSVAPGKAGDIGFPLHPHRGIETLTWVTEGFIAHGDSMGNEDRIGPNESQWMTAGGGLFHSEKITPSENGHEGLQLWFNLPAAQKFIDPQYRAARIDEIPVVTLESGALVRVIAGELLGTPGPFQGIAVQPIVAEVTLPEGASVTLPIPAGWNAFAYVLAGTARFGEAQTEAALGHLAIFCDGDAIAATGPARFLLAAAQPLNEPVLQYRSLVMNTVEQMAQALKDLENGTFAASRPL